MKSLTWSGDYLSLLKPRIVALLVVVAVVTAVVAVEGEFLWGKIALLALAGALACAGSSLLNNYLDRDIDTLMERTKGRPLPKGRVNPRLILLLGLALLALALLAAWWLNYWVTLFVLSGALVYVVLYTLWLKRRSALNIIIGGLAGSCAVLAGWFAVTPDWSLAPLLIALILFLWTPGHFWSFALVHRESYRKANIPMLPVLTEGRKTAFYILLHSGLLLVVSLLLYFLGPFGEVYLAGSLLLGGLFLLSSLQLQRKPQRKEAWRNYKLSGIYLLGLFGAMLLDILI